MGDPLVSVVIPTYNRADLVGRAIESARDQTYENLEIIVVDDASEDDTRTVVKSIDDDRITYVRHETNQHGAAARNTGIERANGEYVAFLDDDDEWYPEKIEKQVTAFREAPSEVEMVYCWAEVYAGDDDGERIAVNKPRLRGNIFRSTLTSNPIGATSTLVISGDALETVDGFDESLERGQDSDLIRRVADRYHVDFVPEILVRHWDHEKGRIQDDDIENLHASINCQEKTLEKFQDHLANAPTQKAQIQLNIAQTYAMTGEWTDCLSWTVAGIRTAPFTPAVYRNGVSVVAQVVKTSVGK